LLFSTAIVGLTIQNGIYPMLFNLYLLRLGYGTDFIGVVNAAGMLSTAVFSLPAGALASRFGLRRTMIAGMGLAVLFHGLLPLVAYLPWGQEMLTLVTRIAGSFAITLYTVSSIPVLMNTTKPEERPHAYAVRQAMWPIFGFLGTFLGGLMPAALASLMGVSTADPATYRWPLVLSCLLSIPAIAALWGTDDARCEAAPEDAKLPAGALPVAALTVMLAVTFFRGACVGVVRTFFNVYLDDGLGLPTSEIGTLYAMAQLASAPAPLIAPLFMKRWGNGRTATVASLGEVLSALPLALIPNVAAAGIGRAGIAGCSSIGYAALSIYQMEIVPPRWRAAMSGATSMASGLSWALLSWVGGYAISGVGYPTLFLAGAGLTGLGAAILFADTQARRIAHR